MTLLLSSFETLNRSRPEAETEYNKWGDVARAVSERLETLGSSLKADALSRRGVEKGNLNEGESASVIEFVLHRLAFLRNSLAHGHEVADEDFKLPGELGGGWVESVARQLLAIHLGQELFELVGLPRSIGTTDYDWMYGHPDFKLLMDANDAGMTLDASLREGLKSPIDGGDEGVGSNARD